MKNAKPREKQTKPTILPQLQTSLSFVFILDFLFLTTESKVS